MAENLGLYIENNLIKYAKVSKEKENVKIEAYGIKFFDNMEKTIDQIVRETFSYKTPMSVNITNEKYTVANIFSLLNKSDLNKAINTEFEYFCNETTKNKNAIEYRYITMPNLQDKDKVRVIYPYVDKANIVEKLQKLDEYKVSTLTPIAMSIGNLLKPSDAVSAAIINLEAKTTITILIDGKPYLIEVLEDGVDKVIKDIAERENSISKAYEICKNTTIYTRAGQNLQLEENDYQDEIVGTLYKIIEKIKDIMEKNQIDIRNIYITGTGAIINNVDLYFQENLMTNKCEILTPFFIEKANVKLNIKDYIEVNSAISLALEGLKTKQDDRINFTNKGAFTQRIKELLSTDIKIGNKTKAPKEKRVSFKDKFNYDMKSDLDWLELAITRGIAGLLIACIVYIGATSFLNKNINAKQKEAEDVISDTISKTEKVSEYTSLVNKRTTQYDTILARIEENENAHAESISRRNAIPNLLNQIMFAVPDEVQILSIENTTDKQVKIVAEAKEYQQLGYFKAAIQNDAILLNVTSTSGVYANGVITVEITGELSY